MENLCCKIECLRQRMHVTALEKGISHPEVLMISCKLDELLNGFYKMSLVKKPVRSENQSGASPGYKLHLCAPARKYRIDRIYRMVGQAVSNV